MRTLGRCGGSDRSRVIGRTERAAFIDRDGPIPGALMVDGFAAGAWHVRRQGADATIVIRPFRPLRPADEAAVRDEAYAMLRFSRPAATGRGVDLERPSAQRQAKSTMIGAWSEGIPG